MEQPIAAARVTNASDLRTYAPNALGAADDRAAIKTWLNTLTMRSPRTLDAYSRDVERFLMWLTQRGKTFSTATVDDAVAHMRFLQAPPPEWVRQHPVSRKIAGARFMRGPLSPRSMRRSVAGISSLYKFLNRHGYLKGNPFFGIGSLNVTRSEALTLDTERSFTPEHLALIRTALHALEDTPGSRRLRALLMLAETTGLRKAELRACTWGSIHLLAAEDSSPDVHHYLRVIGKGRVERKVPLRDSVLAALRAHRADRAVLEAAGDLPVLPEGDTPLFSVLQRPNRMPEHFTGALSRTWIHVILKGFFADVAATMDASSPRAAGLRETFLHASCHWLRHTFAHEVLAASGNDLTVTQQLLGHKSISTTGLYLKADMKARIRAASALPDQFA